MPGASAADSAAAVMWPKTRGDASAVSKGFACSGWQLCRRREDWSLLTHWGELLGSAREWTHLRLFADYELVEVDGVRKTQDILVVKQASMLLWTFRASDLESATLSFVKAPRDRDLATCMLLDVRPMLADCAAEGFSYIVMFECELQAAVVRNLLQRSWCSRNADESRGAHAHRMPVAKKDGGDWRQFLVNTGVDHHPLEACSSWEYEEVSSSVYAACDSAHDEACSTCLPEDELTLDTETTSLDEMLTLDDWSV
jgi:hypothetical protein